MTNVSHGRIPEREHVHFEHLTPRNGMTLVEMLVSMAVTLIMIGFVAQLFGMLGTSVSSSRALVETNDQLRSIAYRLRTDLAGITVDPIPPSRPEAAGGYLEILEGDDNDFAGNYATTTPIMIPNGDCDDALLFTTTSQGDPFVGRFPGGSIESPTAEVAWFCVATGTVSEVPLYSLYRRQLLVTSLVGTGSFSTNNNSIPATLPGAYDNYDLSLRAEGGNLYPNSLSDLCKRENRFLNRGIAFPYLFGSGNGGTSSLIFNSSSTRQGEDLMMTNVIAFDVRVFDPYAEIKILGTAAITPGDPGYLSGTSSTPRTFGAYVDLGSNQSASTTAIGKPTLSGAMQTKSRLTGYQNAVYDTWSLHYEFNGVDDDNNRGIDQGSNNEDDDNPGDPGYGIIDDAGERETDPPYAVALRGLEIRLRVYEPSSRQVRQVTVRHTFVPH
jgi:prepilin-type N-terminal cleavage/methylation domain-containing protein